MTKRFGFTLAEGATHRDPAFQLSIEKKGGTPNSKQSFGFTLAEVLITLGIIGVVAAMTMPTLMNSTNGAQYKAAYKKALSAISQGVTLNVALDGASFADAAAGSAGSISKDSNGNETVGSILYGRMNIVKYTNANDSGYGTSTTGSGSNATTTSNFPGTVSVCKTTDADGKCTATESVTPDTFLFFNDGSMFAFKATDAAKCTNPDPSQDGEEGEKICSGVIDVNGLKGPNKVTTDAEHPTDIYPVIFYDQTILPASDAAKAVLYGK